MSRATFCGCFCLSRVFLQSHGKHGWLPYFPWTATRTSLPSRRAKANRFPTIPPQLKRQTAESTVHREEFRELAKGDRIAFTAADRENRIRSGDFATVERIGDDNSITARLDSGRAVEMDPKKARHIGLRLHRRKRPAPQPQTRILLTGESRQLAEQQAALTQIDPHTREIGIYTSDRANPLQQAQGIATDVQLSEEGFSIDTALGNMPEPTLPEIDFESFGLGL